MKRGTPRFNEVEHVAPRQSNVLRPRYAVGDVLAPLGRDHWVVGVVEDEGWHADYRKERPHVHFGYERDHVSNGSWGRR